MYEKYVRFPYEAARLDTVIKEGDNFVYYYKQELPATENTKKIDLTLDGQILSKDETKTQLPPFGYNHLLHIKHGAVFGPQSTLQKENHHP